MTAVQFVRREFGIDLPEEPLPVCPFSDLNGECLADGCAFFGGQGKAA